MEKLCLHPKDWLGTEGRSQTRVVPQLRGREKQVMEQSFSAEGAEQLWGGPPEEQEKGCGTGSCPRLVLLGLCPSKAAGMVLD